MNKLRNSIKMLPCRKSIQYVTNNNIDVAFVKFNDHYLDLDGISIFFDDSIGTGPVQIEKKTKFSHLTACFGTGIAR
tara:strand:- start:388 stop:618 length:231 start_codon:yes stop_codon:yes gene_type:complete